MVVTEYVLTLNVYEMLLLMVMTVQLYEIAPVYIVMGYLNLIELNVNHQKLLYQQDNVRIK